MDRSHLLIILCVAFLSGIGLAAWVDLPSAPLYLAFLASSVLIFWWWPSPSLRSAAGGEAIPLPGEGIATSPRGEAPRNDIVGWALRFRGIAALVVAVACLGVWRYQQVQPARDEHWVGAYAGRTVTLAGTVVDEPDVRIANARYTVGRVTTSSPFLPVIASKAKQSPESMGLPRRYAPRNDITEGAALRGKVLVTARLYPRYAYGDVLRFTCRLREPEPFNGFAYDRYLARFDIYALCSNPELTKVGEGGHPVRRALLGVKARLQQAIDRSLPEPQSSLFAALLLGTRGGLPRPLLDAFAAAGLTHLIAISGAQITLVVNLLRGVAPYLGVPRRPAFWAISALLAGYLVLIGAPASAVRAGIMGWLLLLAYHLGRQSHPWPMFALAAAAMAWQEPRILRDDVGFELSFAAVAGLILWQPMFERWLRRVPQRGGLRTALAMTLAAQLMTLPLVLVRFGRLSLVAPLANVLVAPLVAVVTVVGIGLLTAALVLPALGWALLLPAWGALAYLVAVAEVASRLPYAAVAWALPAWTLLPMYAALVGWGRKLAVIASHAKRSPGTVRGTGGPSTGLGMTEAVRLLLRLRRIAMTVKKLWAWASSLPFVRQYVSLLAIGLVYVSLLIFGLALTPRTTRLWVLNVGQGDAILIRTPDQRTVVVDGGPDRSLLYGLGRHLPPWVRTVELLVVTHPHTDHYVGFIELLQRYRVRTLLVTGARNDTPEYAEFEAAARASGARVQLVSGPARYDLGGVQLRVLSPPTSLAGSVPANPNDASIVLQLAAGGARALLTGDLERDGLLQLASADVASDLLKVAHHGSADALAPEFYAVVQPAYAVISVGPNHFGHPSLRTEAALQRAGALVLTTQADGDVGFVAGMSRFARRPSGWWPAW